MKASDATQPGILPWELVNVPSRRDLLADLGGRLARGQGFSIATLNLDHAVKLRSDDRFRAAYAAHSHITADGRPIVWLSALAGRPVGLVTGSDLLEPLVRLCAQAGAPVALLGSTEAVLELAAKRLEGRHPGLSVAGRFAPAMGFDPEGPEADALIDRLAASGVRVCLLALGAPKQEIFAARATGRLPDMGFVSIGAGLDFVAGAQRRAPRLFRMLALEWLWRMLSNPARMAGRYAKCFAILPALTGRALRLRLSRQTPAANG